MPWEIQKRGDKYCVIKKTDGSSTGCSETKEKAQAHMRALYASENSVNNSEEFCGEEVHFNKDSLGEAIYHLKLALGSAGDPEVMEHIGEALHLLKELKSEKADMDTVAAPAEDHPLPSPYVTPYATEEEIALVAAGQFEEFPWEGPIVFEGQLTGDNRIFNKGAIEWDSETLPWPFRWQRSSIEGHKGAIPIGRVDKLIRREDGAIYGYGVIIPSLNQEAAEYLRLMEAGVASGVSVDGDSAVFDVQELADGKSQVVFSSMRLRSLTAVDIPAFNQARVGLSEASTELDADEEEEFAKRKRKKKKMEIGNRAHRWNYAVVASAIPVKPTTNWFVEPELDGPTPITVSPDGRVFGHLALFDTCHVGFPGACVKPPKGSNYRYFHVGELETAEGEIVEVGSLTFKTGHASMQASPAAAAAHYDNTGAVAADVRCGEDKFGIWVAGALRPHLTDQDIREFRAAPLSGDWRKIAGRLELVGALAVNTPGFPVPRARALVASGDTQTLFTYSEENDELWQFADALAERISAVTEFHLPGAHDQLEHGKGGRLSGFGGKKKARKEYRKALITARKTDPEFKKLTNIFGGIKLKKVKNADLSKTSTKNLGILHTALQAGVKNGEANIAFGAFTLDPIQAGIGLYIRNSSKKQLGRVSSELTKRGIKATPKDKTFEGDELVDFNLDELVSFQIDSETEFTLDQAIVEAQKLIDSGEIKKPGKLVVTPYMKESVLETIGDLIADGEEDGSESDVSPELLGQLKSFLDSFKDYPVALIGEKEAAPAEAPAPAAPANSMSVSEVMLKLQERAQSAGQLPATEFASKTEDGKAFPSSDYAYVPDAEKPSTWKLRLTDSPGGDPDSGIVGAAVAALGKGFRGNKVSLPAEDRPKVIAKVRAAWFKANPDKKEEDLPPVLEG